MENFDDEILQENGRAHVSKEIYRVRDWIRAQGFRQLNVDLIAGMVGETWESWKRTVDLTIEYDPDSITIYQMEPALQHRVLEGEAAGRRGCTGLRRLAHEAGVARLRLRAVRAAPASSAGAPYTMMRRDRGCKFVYAREVWSGADMIPIGVSSFGHMSGVPPAEP